MAEKQYIAINWNDIEDQIDKATWEKLTEQFWLDTRIPVSNDLDDWRTLGHDEQWVVGHVFGGLTLLDTLQSQDGMRSLMDNIRTQQERAVLNNIQFMESVHAKSYSTIFSTLNTPAEIDEIFEWTNSNKHLQYKANKINDIYHNGSPLEKKSGVGVPRNLPVLLRLLHPAILLGQQQVDQRRRDHQADHSR